MNQRTIKKVLDELAKEKPDLSYIRGLLEGLVDEVPVSSQEIANKIRNDAVTKALVEVTPLDKPMSRIEEIKKLAEESITNG